MDLEEFIKLRILEAGDFEKEERQERKCIVATIIPSLESDIQQKQDELCLRGRDFD